MVIVGLHIYFADEFCWIILMNRCSRYCGKSYANRFEILLWFILMDWCASEAILEMLPDLALSVSLSSSDSYNTLGKIYQIKNQLGFSIGCCPSLVIIGFSLPFFSCSSPISSSYLRLQIIHLFISFAYLLLSSGFYYPTVHKVWFAVVTVLGWLLHHQIKKIICCGWADGKSTRKCLHAE